MMKMGSDGRKGKSERKQMVAACRLEKAGEVGAPRRSFGPWAQIRIRLVDRCAITIRRKGGVVVASGADLL